MIRFFWLTLGMFSLGLGILGIFLPLLPTTPFILLSAGAFAKSSNKLYNYLLNSRYFGSLIKNWQENRRIPLKAKIYSAILMILSLLVSIKVLTD